MQYIIKRKNAVAPIFQPFLGRLIATNVELPCSERNVVEIMRFVYTYTAQLILGVYYFPIFTHYAVSNFVGFPPWGSWLWNCLLRAIPTDELLQISSKGVFCRIALLVAAVYIVYVVLYCHDCCVDGLIES